MQKKILIPLLILAAIIIYGCATFNTFLQKDTTPDIPRANREFRAAWVATVSNIDWPSKPGLTTEEQQAEALVILDKAVELNLNAIVFQVRPHCDAFYESNLEPWSHYLTGKQGQKPDPYYDPLKFWVDESHKRGLELHAWFNPYRAHHPAGGEILDCSIVRRKPDLAKKLSQGYYWLDPAKKETQQHSLDVIMDVVNRYDIDGVHMDDYFYPYPSYNGNEDFPDDDSWQEYQKSGGKLERNDWRRKAVNDFVETLYDQIKDQKKHVKLGISPFGIWRPNNPRSIQGFDQYDVLYADARLWLHEGWVDYFTPQLYWPINQINQSFPVLLGWWKSQNIKQRNLWPGLYTSRVTDKSGVDENINQIMITRGITPMSPGHVHFSVAAFLRPDSIEFIKSLKNSVYREQALIPASRWLDSKAPETPGHLSIHKTKNKLNLAWKNSNKEDVFLNVVYYRYEDLWKYQILPATENSLILNTTFEQIVRQDTLLMDINKIAISAVDKCGNESELTFYDLTK